MTNFKFKPGTSAPFGSTYYDNGVNFSVFSEHATKIELCLYDELGQQAIEEIPLTKGENHCWHLFVEGLPLHSKYAYRAHGPFKPEAGLRFNAKKLLIDPYARKLDRDFCWDDSLFSYDRKSSQKDLSFNDKDSAHILPKSVVTSRLTVSEIENIQARKPNVAWEDTIIYETHVRGFSQLKLDIPSELRGTMAGLAHDISIEYFKALGVTAIELLPIHAFVDEQFLVDQGLSNYWGYNSLNFFLPHSCYLSSGKPEEFLNAVEKLHEAGLEVILDVVYNHTAESNELGPTLSFRGLDNLSYYRLDSTQKRHYINDTGCGNTIRAEHPRVMQMILDSLRFWAGEMGVDGFRFDLASILGRDEKGFSARAAFFQAISQDPLLSKCKLIAEPWDIGPGGYQLGAYPGEWSEWNDKYRDVCRRFWKADKGVLPEFAGRIHGSSDLFEYAGRRPRASLNFITSHDGFTLNDLVSYNDRHNLANKENNRDGHQGNYSDNYGVEGPTENEDICKIRARQQRNFIATLLLSQGTPMLLGGDEFGRTQNGNNNAYCQDNEINWLEWNNWGDAQKNLYEFTAHVISVRKNNVLFRSQEYIHNPENLEKEKQCARWISPSGDQMTDRDWHDTNQSAVGWILERLSNNQKDTVLVLFNSSDTLVTFNLPVSGSNKNKWRLLIDTFEPNGQPSASCLATPAKIEMEPRTLKVLTTTFEKTDDGKQ